jgi:peptide/nickel transport system substrate-binding protein
VSIRNLVKLTIGAAAVAALAVPAMVAAVGTANGETLRVAVRATPAARGNAYQGCICTPAVYTWAATFQQMTKIGDQGEALPFLAESWENIDPLRWRFYLRKDVVFSNGEPMNAAAVKATYDYWRSDEGKVFSQSKTMSRFVSSTEVVDEYTVDVLTPAPDPILPKKVQSQSILPPKAWVDLGLEIFAQEPIGTGPYIVKFSAESAKATPNPRSWLPRKSVTEIEFLALPEAPSRIQALISGQVDINVSVSPDEVLTLEQNGMVVYSKPSTRTMGISYVSHRNGKPVEGPMGDVRVRQALNYAVNKQAIADTIFFGKAGPATQAAFPGINGYNSDIKGYPYNPDKARALLAEAGYADGFDFEVRAITTADDFRLAYEAAVQDLRKLGINATLISQQFAGKDGWLEHWLAGTWPYEAFGIGHDLGATMDAGRAFNVFTSCKKPAPYFCDESEIAAIDVLNVEFDEDKRRQMLKDLLAIHTEKAPILFLLEFEESMGHNPRIKNFRHTTLVIPYHELEVAAK